MVTVEATFCYKVLPNMTAPRCDLVSPECGGCEKARHHDKVLETRVCSLIRFSLGPSLQTSCPSTPSPAHFRFRSVARDRYSGPEPAFADGNRQVRFPGGGQQRVRRPERTGTHDQALQRD